MNKVEPSQVKLVTYLFLIKKTEQNYAVTLASKLQWQRDFKLGAFFFFKSAFWWLLAVRNLQSLWKIKEFAIKTDGPTHHS